MFKKISLYRAYTVKPFLKNIKNKTKNLSIYDWDFSAQWLYKDNEQNTFKDVYLLEGWNPSSSNNKTLSICCLWIKAMKILQFPCA